MKRKPRSLSKIDDDIKSAGQSFIGLRIENMLLRIPDLEDKDRKSQLINEYYEHQSGTKDKDIGGTRTRVNSVIRIIQAGQVVYTLEKISFSDSRVLPQAVEMAKITLEKIKSGRLELPDLE